MLARRKLRRVFAILCIFLAAGCLAHTSPNDAADAERADEPFQLMDPDGVDLVEDDSGEEPDFLEDILGGSNQTPPNESDGTYLDDEDSGEEPDFLDDIADHRRVKRSIRRRRVLRRRYSTAFANFKSGLRFLKDRDRSLRKAVGYRRLARDARRQGAYSKEAQYLKWAKWKDGWAAWYAKLARRSFGRAIYNARRAGYTTQFNCPYWAHQGNCRGRYGVWMKRNCRISCRVQQRYP